MIDWLTMDVKLDLFFPEWDKFLNQRKHWLIVDGGEIVGCRHQWEKLTSDSQKVSILPREHGFMLAGSPAYVMGQSDNVFGESDLLDCAEAMIEAATSLIAANGCNIKNRVTDVEFKRLDNTFNILMNSEAELLQLIESLNHIDSGRYRTTRKYGTTVYLGGKSRTMKSKLYSKGRQSAYMMKKGLVAFNSNDMDLLNRVLRLEVEYGRDFFRRLEGSPYTFDFEKRTTEYWSKLFGEMGEVKMGINEFQKVLEVAPTDRMAKNSYRTLQLIRSEGQHNALLTMGRATFFRHKKILSAAGFGEASMSAGGCEFLNFPIKTILGRRIDSWVELRNVA